MGRGKEIREEEERRRRRGAGNKGEGKVNGRPDL